MAYSYETSSVKTINGEVSGLADVVARQAIANLPTLSGGEGIQLVNEDGKTRIDLGLSAGSNMSFVYDQETNTIRLDSEGSTYSGIAPIVVNNTTKQISADTWAFSAGNGLIFSDDNENKVTRIDVNENFTNYYKKTETSSKQEISAALNNINTDITNINNDIQYVSANAGHTYTGDDPIYVNNETNHIGITGESLSAGPNIDIFASGGYVVISANGGGDTFPITGTDGTTNYTANCDCSSFYFTTAQGPAGANTTMTVKGVHYQAYPSTDVSASWYNIINTTNNSSNCYCIRFQDGFTAADLANYSAYDKVTVVHSNEYTPDCMLYWDGNTKVFPSGLYCELVKGTNDENQTDWFFTNSGWTNNLWWDWD